MIHCSIIQKTQLESGQRLDAEYYQPEYLDYSTQLNKLSQVAISDVCRVTDGNHLTISEQFADSGVRYLRGKDLQDFFLSDTDPMYIPEETYLKLKRSHVFQGDVLVSIVGTIGLVSVVADNFDKLTGSCKIAILHPKNIDPWYLSAFLASTYGQFQLQRLTGGAVQTGVILKDMSTLRILRFGDDKENQIANMIKIAYEKQLESKKLYQNAENLLLQELGLIVYQISNDLAFEVYLSEVKNAERMDADYFQPKYQWIIDKIGKKKRMSEMAKRIKNTGKHTPDTEYNYIEISDVNVSNGEITFNKIVGKELPANAKIGLSGGELIISKVRPTRGAIAIIPQEFSDNFIASGAFSVYNVDYPTREYLQVVFRSIVGKLQLERPTTGTSYPTITDEDIENMWIPDLSLEIQQKIADLVRRSHEARKKSKALLEEAKRKVEEMIEKNDKKI